MKIKLYADDEEWKAAYKKDVEFYYALGLYM